MDQQFVFTPLNQLYKLPPTQILGISLPLAENFSKKASGVGHCYGASDPWVRRAAVAAAIQEPPGVPGFSFPLAFTNDTTHTESTLHPNALGQQE